MSAEPTPAAAAPRRVAILDTTLRDGEQSPGISLDADEKVSIATQLARLGVDVIEAGFPIASVGDHDAVRAVAAAVPGPVICGLARAQAADIEACASALREAERPRIHTFISTSDVHIEHQLQSTRADVLGQARASVAHARSLCEDVEFTTMDCTRADVEFTAEVIAAALEEGARTINIPDTVGYALPHEYAELVRRLHQLVPALSGAVLSVHCHDDLGLAVANTVAGVLAGAGQAECTINGIGERAGNAALEELAVLFDVHDGAGLTTGIELGEIARTSRLVSQLTGYDVQPSKAIVGGAAFATAAGREVLQGFLDPRRVGLDLAGTLTDAERDAARADRIAESADQRKLLSYEVHDALGRPPFARVSVRDLDGEECSAECSAEGPVEALLGAISAAVGRRMTLQRFSIRAVSEDSTSLGHVAVVVGAGAQEVTAHAVAPDVLEAAGRAYLRALERADRLRPQLEVVS